MISIDRKKETKLTSYEMSFMNKYRRKYFGPKTKPKDFKKEYIGADFFFVKEGSKVLAFGILKPITIEYHSKRYNILGIANIVTVTHGKDHGRMLMAAITGYLKEKGKTGLGFCFPNISGFYKKCGLGIIPGFIKRFEYTDGKTIFERKDSEGDGLYLEGKDRFVSKALENKDIIPIPVPFW